MDNKINLTQYINSDEFEIDFKDLLDFEKVGSHEKVTLECKTGILNYDSLLILQTIFENKEKNLNLENLNKIQEELLRKRLNQRINKIFAKEDNDLTIDNKLEDYLILFKNLGFEEIELSKNKKLLVDYKNNILINITLDDSNFKCVLISNGKMRKHIKDEDKLEEIIGTKISGTEIDYIRVDLKELPLFKIQKVIEIYKSTAPYYIDSIDLEVEELVKKLSENDKLSSFFDLNCNLLKNSNFDRHMNFMKNLSLEEKEDILYRLYIFGDADQDKLLFNEKITQKIINENIDINMFKITLNELRENENTITHSYENYIKIIATFGDYELKVLKEKTIDEKYMKLIEEDKNKIDLFIENNKKLINVNRKVLH